METESYMSFLVRLWRDHPASDQPCWQGEIEHIQTGTRCRFSSLEELLALLRRAVTASHLLTSGGGLEAVAAPSKPPPYQKL